MPRKIIAPSIAAVIAASMMIAVMPVAAARNIDTPSPAVKYPGRYVKVYADRIETAPEDDRLNTPPLHAPSTGGTSQTSGTDEFTAALIDESLDIILSTDECFVSERQYIEASPDAFDKIVSLGEDALPYLLSLADNAGCNASCIVESSEDFRPFVAMAAAYEISPELYDRTFTSPDGNYSLVATVNTFYQTIIPYDNISYKLSLYDNRTGEIIAAPPEIYVFPNGIDGSSNVNWSPDGRYIALTRGYGGYTVTELFDVANAEVIRLPHAEEIEDIIGKPLVYTDKNGEYDRVRFSFSGWGNRTVKIRISLSSPDGTNIDVGWYAYDIDDRNVSYIEHIIR